MAWDDGGSCWCNCGICDGGINTSVSLRLPLCGTNSNLDCDDMCFLTCNQNGYCLPHADAEYWKCRCFDKPQNCTMENRYTDCPCMEDGDCVMADFCCIPDEWGNLPYQMWGLCDE